MSRSASDYQQKLVDFYLSHHVSEVKEMGGYQVVMWHLGQEIYHQNKNEEKK